MLKHAKKNVEEIDLTKNEVKLNFVHQEDPLSFPAAVLATQFDFIYSFDVFVHVDIHTLHRTLKQVGQILKPEGRMMLSVANLCSEIGFARFDKQKEFKVAGFYFMSPDIIKKIVKQNGFTIVEIKYEGCDSGEAESKEKNIYYDRDIVLLI